jgi:hypothetical protein
MKSTEFYCREPLVVWLEYDDQRDVLRPHPWLTPEELRRLTTSAPTIQYVVVDAPADGGHVRKT